MPQYLGQHFLKNKEAINKIIAALDIHFEDIIIEIGPGKGALTLPLAQNAKSLNSNIKILAIEKDEELANELSLKIKELKLENIEIVKGDALKILPQLILKLGIKNYKLVGNIPYYITGKLFRTISELNPSTGGKPQKCVLMVQKEVAERVAAVPPHNNLLAGATAIWANVEIMFKLKAEEFDPPPAVDSAVIRLTPNNKKLPAEQLEKYYKLIHIIFKQPRKTLANNLKDGLKLPRSQIENILKTIDLPQNARPQDVSTERILKIIDLTVL